MGKMGSFNLSDLKELQKSLQKLKAPDLFVKECAKELAARLLRMAVKRTPVGEYNTPVSFTTKNGEEVSFTPHTGKVGGTLRRGWTIGEIRKEGKVYVVEIVNPVEYASYVEYGHRTPDHEGWVKGQFMMTISEQELERIAPRVLENKIKRYLEGCLK